MQTNEPDQDFCQKGISFESCFDFLLFLEFLMRNEKIVRFKSKISCVQNIILQIAYKNWKMSLNPLIRIVKSTLNRDPVEEIFWGNPTAETYAKALTNYLMFPMDMRY